MPTETSGRGKSEGSKRTQAKPGERSKNPTGRPPGSKNRNAIIRAVLSQVVTADVGGAKKRITLTEASLLRLAQKAMAGDLQSINSVLRLWKESEDGFTSDGGGQYPMSDADKAVIEEIYARMKASEAG